MPGWARLDVYLYDDRDGTTKWLAAYSDVAVYHVPGETLIVAERDGQAVAEMTTFDDEPVTLLPLGATITGELHYPVPKGERNWYGEWRLRLG